MKITLQIPNQIANQAAFDTSGQREHFTVSGVTFTGRLLSAYRGVEITTLMFDVERAAPHTGLGTDETDVREFMAAAQQDLPAKPVIPEEIVRLLRVRLIAEELAELADAYGVELHIERLSQHKDYHIGVHIDPDMTPNLVEAYDAYIDLKVVVVGGALSQGTKLTPGWNEVHRTNMAKFGPGSQRRADGKMLKPPGWQAPDLAPIIAKQSGA